MKAEMNAGMFFEMLEKGKVGIVVRLFQNVLEIPAGLVSVNEKSKMEGSRHGCVFSRYHDSKPRKFLKSERR